MSDGAADSWRSRVLTAICLIVVAALLPRETQFVRASNLAASLRQMVAHLRNPKLLATYAVGFGVLFNFIAVFTYMSFHLAAPPFYRSAAFIGSIFVVYLAGAAAAALTGRMIAAIGRRTFVLCILAAWACGILLMLIPSVAGDRAGAGDRLDLRRAHASGLDQLRRHHRAGRHVLGGRALRHLVLCRRHGSAAGSPASPMRRAAGPRRSRWCSACWPSWRPIVATTWSRA